MRSLPAPEGIRLTPYLFVYGSLKRSFTGRMHPLLRGARYVGVGTVSARLVRVSWYPGAVPTDESRLTGEVYRLTQVRRRLQRLDLYEGCRRGSPRCGLFRRAVVRVVLAGGDAVSAWVYWYNRPARGLPIYSPRAAVRWSGPRSAPAGPRRAC